MPNQISLRLKFVFAFAWRSKLHVHKRLKFSRNLSGEKFRVLSSTQNVFYSLPLPSPPLHLGPTRLVATQEKQLLISRSGSWPHREGLLIPAVRQIYRRKFPPVGFIQSWTVLLMRRRSNPITPHETWLELFWSKLRCVFFGGLYYDFVSSPVFKYKAECKCVLLRTRSCMG